jgi:lipopolysaccharide transport system ATP-binding protein
MSTVIRVENISKKYIIGHHKKDRHATLRDAISNGIKNLFSRKSTIQEFDDSTVKEEFWALKDVSFEIKQGDRVGIIGLNGAGKSTLLKILSRITKPTSGRISIKGRVSSLLEVGTGFHPELTGRENIYLNGAVLGMSKRYIKSKFDEIVAFADVEKFIDTPVKHYSSGMYVRLAFAVAAHMEPEILIVDEVLAVGDVLFQKKCMGKMEEVGKEGSTVLFVSHNMEAISSLTTSCIVLSKGERIFHGPTDLSIKEYLRFNEKKDLIYTGQPSPVVPKITRVELHTSEASNVQKNRQPMDVYIQISSPVKLENPAISFHVIDLHHRSVAHLWAINSEIPFGRSPGEIKLSCQIPKVRLYMGQYTLKVHFSEQFGKKNSQTIEGICPFEVVMYGQQREFNWDPNACTYTEDCEWTVS